MSAEVKSGKTEIEFACSPSLKEKAKAAAKRQKKSLAQFMRDLLQETFKRKK